MAVSVCFFGGFASSQTKPAVRALLVLPTQFKDGADVMVQDGFAKRGKEFLTAFRKRAPELSSAEILEGPDVTRKNVLDRLDANLKLLTTPGSIFVFYYAGHGIRPGGSNPNVPGSRRSTYLAMQNCQVGDTNVTHDETMLFLEEIMGLQSNYEGVYFLGYLDACYSGNETFPADRVFWSETLGPRGFLLCSSGSDRKSYNSDFTEALTTVYERDDTFKNVHTPEDLRKQMIDSHVFATEQVPQLIPDGCPMEINYPLPGLCFYCIDFGGTINYPIMVKITPPNGRSIQLSLNKQKGNGDPPQIASVAFPVQQLNNTSIVINFDSSTQCKFDVDLAGRAFDRKSLRDFNVPRRRILDANAGASRLAAVGRDFQSVVNRAKRFGLSDPDLTKLCEPVLASSFGKLDPVKSQRFISEQVAFLAQNAPNSPDVDSLRLLARLSEPSVDQHGFVVLERALRIGLPVTPQLATVYAQNIQENVAMLQEGSDKAWIRPADMTQKFARGSQAAHVSGSSTAHKILQDSLATAVEPGSRILSSHDFHNVRVIMSSPASPTIYGARY